MRLPNAFKPTDQIADAMKPFRIALLVLSTLFPAVQLFALPNISDKLALLSQYFGMAGLILMSWAQIWATRLPGVEALFGGLDRVYVLHKWAGIIALAALFAHDTIGADMRGLGPETALSDFAESLGEISLYGILILIGISIATFIPYHFWKWTHKAMGALFIVGAVHFTLILKPFAMTDAAGLYTGAFCLAGFFAYAWTLLPAKWSRSSAYTVISATPTGGATAITLQPSGRALAPQPGQFGVFRFSDAGRVEPHPFSFSKIGSDQSLRVTVKALGDDTQRLGHAVTTGQRVLLQGPFGHFQYRAKRPQIWVAGGIGITPFLSWADAIGPSDPEVTLFYGYRSRAEAPHLEEIEALAAAKANLHLRSVCSSEGERISGEFITAQVGEKLSGYTVAFCGPTALRESLQRELRKRGVHARRFLYEAFEFRTGIGLQALANWVMRRWRRSSHA